MEIRMDAVMTKCYPGDILLTRNPAGIGKLINFGQRLEEGGGKSTFGHIAIMSKAPGQYWAVDGGIYESVKTISKNRISDYSGSEILIIRHKGMLEETFFLGREEILDNIGQVYPAHRILFHGFDMVNAWIKRKVFRSKNPLGFRYMKFMPLDWPVCSELGAQFIQTARLEGGWEKRKKGWRGVNPDDFHDASLSRQDLWQVILSGRLV